MRISEGEEHDEYLTSSVCFLCVLVSLFTLIEILKNKYTVRNHLSLIFSDAFMCSFNVNMQNPGAGFLLSVDD